MNLGLKAHLERFSSMMGVEEPKLAAGRFSENTSTRRLPALDATGGLAEFKAELFPKFRRSEGGEEFTWKRSSQRCPLGCSGSLINLLHFPQITRTLCNTGNMSQKEPMQFINTGLMIAGLYIKAYKSCKLYRNTAVKNSHLTSRERQTMLFKRQCFKLKTKRANSYKLGFERDKMFRTENFNFGAGKKKRANRRQSTNIRTNHLPFT